MTEKSPTFLESTNFNRKAIYLGSFTVLILASLYFERSFFFISQTSQNTPLRHNLILFFQLIIRPTCGIFLTDLQLNSCIPLSSSSYSSIGTTAHRGLWPVEKCLSICSYLPPTLSIFSLPAHEDLFLLPLSTFSWVFPFFSSLTVLGEDLFGHPILLHSL